MRYLILAALALAAFRGFNDELPAAAFLAALPDGEAKSRFILDCTGCHTFRDNVPYPNGQARTREGWDSAIARMVGMFGPQSSFPVIGHGRAAAATAQWLHENLPPRERIEMRWPAALERKADMREYLIPEARDLPHDVAVMGDTVLVTGMFTSRLYLIDAQSGNIRTEPTPAPNPRAIEIAPNGDWWVVLGGPRKVARRTPNGEWSMFDAGFYAHSVAIGSDRVWVNGHFTHNPELLRSIEPGGATQDFTVPAHPSFQTTTVPYEVRVSADGAVWMTELQGNRLVRLKAGKFSTWHMPTPWSGPRRHDIDADGNVWIPEYSANKLARFDARTETFKEYALPIKDALPYVARYDMKRKLIWIGTGAADALLSFDPVKETFAYYRLPTKDQLVRHMVIAENGDVWLAPGSSPGSEPARVVRVRPLP